MAQCAYGFCRGRANAWTGFEDSKFENRTWRQNSRSTSGFQNFSQGWALRQIGKLPYLANGFWFYLVLPEAWHLADIGVRRWNGWDRRTNGCSGVIPAILVVKQSFVVLPDCTKPKPVGEAEAWPGIRPTRRREWRRAPGFAGVMAGNTRCSVSSGGSPDETGQWPVPPWFYLVLPVDGGRPGGR